MHDKPILTVIFVTKFPLLLFFCFVVCHCAAAQFKEISHAFDILSDPDKRAAYDRYGKEGTNVTLFYSLISWTPHIFVCFFFTFSWFDETICFFSLGDATTQIFSRAFRFRASENRTIDIKTRKIYLHIFSVAACHKLDATEVRLFVACFVLFFAENVSFSVVDCRARSR
jgi:hypothetical protein